MGSINQNIPGRTNAQRRLEDPDEYRAENRRHYLRHREHFKARSKQWYAENVGSLRATLAKHQERNEAEMAHMPWSPADRHRVYPCPCGGKTSWNSRKTHYRTMRHVKWLKNLPEPEPEKEQEPEAEKEEGPADAADASGSGSCAEPP